MMCLVCDVEMYSVNLVTELKQRKKYDVVTKWNTVKQE